MAKEFKVTKDILNAFGFPENSPVSVMQGGHINSTFRVDTPEGVFVVQRINHFVFPSPENVMENITGVTDFIREKISAQGGDPDRATLTVRRTVDGGTYYLDSEGEYWRCTIFIENATAHEVAADPSMLEEAGRAFGNFQKMLSDYPADTLHEIIVNFHNTPDRFRQLREAIENDTAGHKKDIAAEIAFAEAREESCGKLMKLLGEGKLPLRVTHNDTKMSNVLIDDETGKYTCAIDLDTVMPGLAAFDFGDSIRAGASTAAEDEADLTKVSFDFEKFEAYTKGFLAEAGEALTETELETLPDGAILMTFECGIRFLADYLNGSVYFRTAYPEHNLVRARNQFKLVEDMEKGRARMDEIVRSCAK